jgi:2,4-dienoyl-CoA reductase-like NADH-dependent reductase (Old Yellow Enzyme family)
MRLAMTTPAESMPLTHGPAWANRYALAPMTNKTCAAYVADTGRTWTGQLGIASDQHLPGLTRLAEGLRATGSRSLVQLHHGGRRADPGLAGRLLAPFDDAETGLVGMCTDEVQQLVQDFVAAAVRAERAGFDGVEVHGAHGFVLAQFLDGRNQRSDGYGGCLEHRMRALVEVLAGIRAATSDRFQVGIRLSPEAKGTPLDEGREVVRQVLSSGVVDFVDMSLFDVYARPHYNDDGGLLIDAFTGLPRGDTVLGVTGHVLSTEDAAWCLARGADTVGIGVGAILHHDFANRALADPDFKARPQPVSRDVLRAELVGPAFIDYLAADWDDLVA